MVVRDYILLTSFFKFLNLAYCSAISALSSPPQVKLSTQWNNRSGVNLTCSPRPPWSPVPEPELSVWYCLEVGCESTIRLPHPNKLPLAASAAANVHHES